MTTKEDITAVGTVPDGAKSIKTFKSSTELEAFIRFVHDNGLRREAYLAIDFLTKSLKPKKKTRAARTKKAKTLQ